LVFSDYSSEMKRHDRLSALFDRFSLTLRQAAPEAASLLVLARQADQGCRVLFRPAGCGIDHEPDTCLFSAIVEWGGVANPLVAALPPLVSFDLAADVDGRLIVSLLQVELAGNRCGSSAVVNRLCEVLLIRILRARIEVGATEPGLVAGLADQRLSRAIVAMHEQPGRDWHNVDLAHEAGLSLSQFIEVFSQKVGTTPAAYLRQWRLTLARQDAVRGDRVEAIARRYGYASPEGFARAFKKRFGRNPVDLRSGRTTSPP
jgi:AraC-like DNA-binding protein